MATPHTPWYRPVQWAWDVALTTRPPNPVLISYQRMFKQRVEQRQIDPVAMEDPAAMARACSARVAMGTPTRTPALELDTASVGGAVDWDLSAVEWIDAAVL